MQNQLENYKERNFFSKKFAALKKVVFLQPQNQAEIAQLVEHDLAKVGVASSSLVFRSIKVPSQFGIFYVSAWVVELVDTRDLKSLGL